MQIIHCFSIKRTGGVQLEQQNVRTTIQPGQHIESWTVLDAFTYSKRNKKKWLCRCACGTERYVLERSLKYGSSQSCGCLKRNRANQTNSYNMLGKEFGDLKVVGRSKKRTKMGSYWTCLCKCGYTCEATSSQLISGKKTHCGCKTVYNYAFKDITGQRFGLLTAKFRVKSEVGRGGSAVWHCRCECGNELDICYNDLVYSNRKSCGCQKIEHNAKLRDLLIHVDGTSIDAIRKMTIPNNNTTGYRGVYRVKDKFFAKIVFQKKQYMLGTYNTLEEAAVARRAAEKVLFDGTVQFYEKWKAKETRDPEWGKNNPVSIQVEHASTGELKVHYFPPLNE